MLWKEWDHVCNGDKMRYWMEIFYSIYTTPLCYLAWYIQIEWQLRFDNEIRGRCNQPPTQPKPGIRGKNAPMQSRAGFLSNVAPKRLTPHFVFSSRQNRRLASLWQKVELQLRRLDRKGVCVCVCVCVAKWRGGGLGKQDVMHHTPFPFSDLFYFHFWGSRSVTYNTVMYWYMHDRHGMRKVGNKKHRQLDLSCNVPLNVSWKR